VDGDNRFIDDYIKIFKKEARIKRNFKVFGQVGLGLIVGAVLFQSCSNSANRYWKGCFRVTTENVVTVSPVEEKIYSHHDTFL
jgi:phospho-N-acetylmuramoyl-pentapeptide-transferase